MCAGMLEFALSHAGVLVCAGVLVHAGVLVNAGLSVCAGVLCASEFASVLVYFWCAGVLIGVLMCEGVLVNAGVLVHAGVLVCTGVCWCLQVCWCGWVCVCHVLCDTWVMSACTATMPMHGVRAPRATCTRWCPLVALAAGSWEILI